MTPTDKTRARPAMPPAFSLRDRVVFLSGASGHLGKAMAYSLAHAGAHVILNGRNRKTLAALAAELDKRGLSASVAAFDVSRFSELGAQLKKALHAHKRLDVVINNAYSVMSAVRRTGTTARAFEESYQVVTIAAHELVMAAMPWLKAAAKRNAGGASVINIASMYGVVSPDPSVYGDSDMNSPAFYGAAKAGLIQMTRYLACHLAADGIRVNSISPGPFPSPAVQRRAPAFIKRLRHKVPLGRIGVPEDLAGPVLFLASNASSYMTGSNLPVDGGWTAW